MNKLPKNDSIISWFFWSMHSINRITTICFTDITIYISSDFQGCRFAVSPPFTHQHFSTLSLARSRSFGFTHLLFHYLHHYFLHVPRTQAPRGAAPAEHFCYFIVINRRFLRLSLSSPHQRPKKKELVRWHL